MNTILLPTDFSDNSIHAIRYALTLNKKIKAKAVLFHSYVIPVYATDVPVVMPVDSELKKASEEALSKILSELQREFPELKLSMDVQQGYPEDEIVRAAGRHKCDLILMGTRGASGLKEVLVGTITASIMESASCPVIAVPDDASLRVPQKMVFATNYAEGDLLYVEQVVELARLFDAEVILLHISSGEYEKTYEFDAIERFKERIKEDSRYKQLSFRLLESKDVYDGLSLYLDEVKADFVAMTMRKRSFMQKLFSRSITRKMVYHTHIPLMAFRTPSS